MLRLVQRKAVITQLDRYTLALMEGIKFFYLLPCTESQKALKPAARLQDSK